METVSNSPTIFRTAFLASNCLLTCIILQTICPWLEQLLPPPTRKKKKDKRIAGCFYPRSLACYKSSLSVGCSDGGDRPVLAPSYPAFADVYQTVMESSVLSANETLRRAGLCILPRLRLHIKFQFVPLVACVFPRPRP